MKKRIIIIICAAVLTLVLGGVYLLTREKFEFGTPKKTEGLTIVPTMQDEITADSAWAGTFQLVWNDLINEVVGQDVVFTPQEIMVTNLNKQEFTNDMISDSSYYKTYGLKTLELKAEIEKAIKEKFNQTSDILDSFDWSDDALNDSESSDDRYFFYVMLYKKFEYIESFSKLDNGSFGEYDNVEYFGIDSNSSDGVRDQIDVLFYNSSDDFAILINTDTNDEIIFYKNPNGTTFKEIYDNMNIESDNYDGYKSFKDTDEFKAPNIIFNEIRNYDELTNKKFITADGNEAEILQAVQTIQFYLNEQGGEIKSEAAIDMNSYTSADVGEVESRIFNVDDTFAIFIREKGEEIPYFAARVDDITKFQ